MVGETAERTRRVGGGLADRLFPSDPGQIIAYSRLVLAVFALLAIFVDPTQPAKYAQFAYLLLASYATYALVLVLISGGPLVDGDGALARHAVDIVVFAVLLYLTEGPTSPFFVFFTFAIVSGAVRWGAAGAIGTALVLLVVYLAASVVQLETFDTLEINRVILRSAYLLVASALIGYFGAQRQRSRDRLARLAAWPPPRRQSGDQPELESSLQHAALVLQVQRILVVWTTGGTLWEAVLWDGSTCQTASHPRTPEEPLVAAALHAATFIGTAAAGGEALLPEGQETTERQTTERPLVAWLAQAYAISAFSTAPFATTSCTGRVFILNPAALGSELLSLTEIVAGRVSLEFEHLELLADLANAAAARERSRLARDMHDSILQNLAAAAMQVKASALAAPPEARHPLEEVLAVLAAQQKRIRQFLVSANPRIDPSEVAVVADALLVTSAELAAQWGCQVRCDVQPPHGHLVMELVQQLQLILAEAVANAVRHGNASEIDVQVRLADDVRMEVHDNGKGEPQRSGGAGDGAVVPQSLARRVEERGGTCRLEVTGSGALLTLSLPRRSRQ